MCVADLFLVVPFGSEAKVTSEIPLYQHFVVCNDYVIQLVY